MRLHPVSLCLVLLALPITSDRVAHAAEEPAPVTSGVFPKSILIPGTETSFSIGGYLKADFIQDFDAMGNADQFKVASIPIDGSAAAAGGPQTTIHARESRLNLEVRSPQVRAFVEGDFFGSGNAFRLRHAYGVYGSVLAGQTWTTFMDISARPQTVDYEGPDAEVFVRQPMIRWTQQLTEQLKWAIAVESPTPEFVLPVGGTGAARASVPDVPMFLRYESDRWHAQAAAVLHQVRYDGGPGEENVTEFGWGVNGTFKARTFGKDEIMGQLMVGDGVAHYVEAVSGQNLDAVFTGPGELETIPLSAVVLGYTHHWSAKVRTGLAYGMVDVSDDPATPGSAVAQTQDARANVIWTPTPLVDFATELLWGRLEHRNGGEGEAIRAQFAVTYRLN